MSLRCRLLGSLALIGLVAGPAPAQTLQEALVSAYLGNPQLEADRARQRATDEDVSRAWGGYRPQVLISGQAGLGRDKVWIPQEGVNQADQLVRYDAKEQDFRKPNQEAVQLKQEIWDGDRTFADVTRSKWSVANGRAILMSTEQTVLGGAVQAYYDLYRDQRIVEIQRAFVQALEGEKKAAIARYGVKDVTRTDVAQAEARLARGIADLRQYEGNLETSRSAFTLAIGFEPGEHLPDPTPIPANLIPQSVEEALSLVEDNPDLRATVFAEKAAEADIDLAESALKPDVSVSAIASHAQHVDYTGTQITSGQVLLTVTMPLYDGGVASARTRSAKHTFGQRRLNTDLQRIRTRDAIRRSWESVLSNRERIKALEENERANLIALKGVQQELKVGSRTEIDELNAQQEVLDARIALLRTQHDAAVSMYSLLLNCGRLTAAAMQLPVTLYDANDHYDSASWMPWSPWIDKDYPTSTPVDEKELPGGSAYPGLPDLDIKLPDIDFPDLGSMKMPF